MKPKTQVSHKQQGKHLQNPTKTEFQKQQGSKVVTVPSKKTHTSTIIWMHGLTQSPQTYLHIFNNEIFDNTKIIAIGAPVRHVTLLNKKTTSWFDIKFRNQNSFKVPFDQAFSKAQVLDSYQNYIKPWIHKARAELPKQGKLIIAGFSQGCGMSLFSFWQQKDKIDAAVGICGYLFPFTKIQPTQRFHKVLLGKADTVRPWQLLKDTYQNKIPMKKIVLVDQTGHQINQSMTKVFHNTIKQLLKKQFPKL